MEKEIIIKLNEIRKDLDISEDDFIDIMVEALNRRLKSSIVISDELLCEIIISALSEYDYQNDYENVIINFRKDKKMLIERAISSLSLE